MNNKKIDEALKEAYEGEAKAVLKLKVYAAKADTEGYPEIAKLFRVVAASEAVHGTRALMLLRESGTTEENLAAGFESEEKVARVSYERFIQEALEDGNRTAELLFTQSRDVEETHARLYKKALDSMVSGRETSYFICEVCGYVSEDVSPETCPVCGAKRERFYDFDNFCR
ncbi:MAG TPA: rubrerythrin family protein [Deltaproteobacteria bacterium]|nr:rubrerythrin family protein [Deltaproteobacteria bacterium]